jgi:hypothetical protein
MAFPVVRKKRKAMSTHLFIQLLLATEIRLAENFIKIGEYYKTEPGIYYGCQEMASISNDHLRRIRTESAKYKKITRAAEQGNSLSLIRDHEPGADLVMDLRFMWLLTMEASILNNLLIQVSSGDPESDPDPVFCDFDAETEKQSQWLMYRINITARKATAEA